MQQRYLGQLEPGLEVCDLAGETVGTIAHVHRWDPARVSSAAAAPVGQDELPPLDEVLEVKTGLLGLGSHLYIPLSVIRDVSQGCAFVSRLKHEFESLGWHDKPAYLDQLA